MEMIDILSPAGQKTGQTKPKDAVHRDGDWHLAVHIWVRSRAGHWLLQRRSPQKVNDPNYWDISVAGHVAAGETALVAAQREVAEEIGLAVEADELEPLFLLKEPRILNAGTYLDREFHQVYLLRRSPSIQELTLQVEEVAEVRWFAAPQLRQWVSQRHAGLVPHWEEYDRLLAQF